MMVTWQIRHTQKERYCLQFYVFYLKKINSFGSTLNLSDEFIEALRIQFLSWSSWMTFECKHWCIAKSNAIYLKWLTFDLNDSNSPHGWGKCQSHEPRPKRHDAEKYARRHNAHKPCRFANRFPSTFFPSGLATSSAPAMKKGANWCFPTNLSCDKPVFVATICQGPPAGSQHLHLSCSEISLPCIFNINSVVLPTCGWCARYILHLRITQRVFDLNKTNTVGTYQTKKTTRAHPKLILLSPFSWWKNGIQDVLSQSQLSLWFWCLSICSKTSVSFIKTMPPSETSQVGHLFFCPHRSANNAGFYLTTCWTCFNARIETANFMSHTTGLLQTLQAQGG